MCDHCSTHSASVHTQSVSESRKDMVDAIAEVLRTVSSKLGGHPVATLKEQKEVDLSKIKKELESFSDDMLVRLFNMTA